MKKIFRYTYVALAGVMAFLATSCADEYDYDGAGELDPGAFISASSTSMKFAAEDEQIFSFTLQRTDSETSEEVKLTCNNSKFQVPASVSFAAGENKKTVLVPFSILGGTTESVTVSVAPESATVYGVGEMTFVITRDFVWEYLGVGVYSSWLLGSWEQPIYRGEGTQLYKLPDCIAEGYDLQFELTADGQHLANPMSPTETGYVHPSYGMIYIQTDGDIQREDNVIYLMTKYTVSAGSFGSKYDVIELPE